MSTVIYNEVLLVGGIEATFRTPGTPNLMTDVFDVGEIAYTPNIERLTRNVQRASLSPVKSRAGRKSAQMTFAVEINGGGSGTTAVAPMYDRLLRMCGLARTALSAPGIAAAFPHPDNDKKTHTLGQGTGNAYTGTIPRLVMVEAVAVGAVRITSPETGNGDAAFSVASQNVTTGTAFDGPQGAKLALTFTTPLTIGDKWFALLAPRGHLYSPIANAASMESGYLYWYAGNKRHLMTGIRGTVSMSATAGQAGLLNFTLTGDYHKPVDMAMPAAGSFSYGNWPDPAMVEMADLMLDGVLVSCPTTYGWDMANTVNARLCANARGANAGANLTARAPTATFNMDSVPLAAMDVWTPLDDGSQLILSGYVGYDPGNSFMFIANGQMTNTAYANLDGDRKNDNTLGLVGRNGNDELLIFVA